MGCKNSKLRCGLLLCASDEQEKLSLECVDDPCPFYAMVIDGRAEYPMQSHSLVCEHGEVNSEDRKLLCLCMEQQSFSQKRTRIIESMGQSK